VTDVARAALELAAAAIGVREHPPGSNRGPEIDEYLRNVGLDRGMGSYPWCAAFVCTMATAAGALQLRKSAACLRLVELNHALALPVPEDGCIFVHLLPDGHGHTGFVERVNDDGTLATIEGNTDGSGSRTGGCVMRQQRAAGYAQVYLAVK
jgi:hypothetical protein